MSDTSDAPRNPEPTAAPASRGERRFRQWIGVSLAVLATLGAWIAVLQTDASTNEGQTTRQATRLASEAQTAAVVENGVLNGLDEIDIQLDLFSQRPVFHLDSDDLPGDATVDPQRSQQRLEDAQTALSDLLDADGARATEVAERARRLSLEQSVVVDQRVTWNAHSSQFETVLTALAVAIFLIGFSLVVDTKLRPLFAVPGAVLAVVCAGWATQIYLKPIPDVAADAIAATAAGQVAQEQGRVDDALADFNTAIEADEDYFVSRRGRAMAVLLQANPDLLTTFAITDDSDTVTDRATEQIDRALEMGGDTDATSVSFAGIIAFVAGDWDRAAEMFEQAIEMNESTPGLHLSRAAVAIAQRDEATATRWLQSALTQMRELAGTDTDRKLAAQFLTQLEWIPTQEPDSEQLAVSFRDQSIALISEARLDAAGDSLDPTGPSEPSGPTEPTVSVASISFADDVTSVDVDTSGIPEGAQIVIAGYERPTQDSAWVQPTELFYVGPDVRAGTLSVDSPRKCTAVEYRFDLYVNAEFVTSATHPGGAATC